VIYISFEGLHVDVTNKKYVISTILGDFTRARPERRPSFAGGASPINIVKYFFYVGTIAFHAFSTC